MSIKKIGVDFDNTIISYDEIFHQLALKEHLIDTKTPAVKQSIRDTVRLTKDGEIAWQKLQANVYGPMISQAKLFDGFKDFLILCQEKKIGVFIVSHKTRFAAQNDRDDMHVAALSFINQHGLLDKKQYGLSREQVFFEPTRQGKIERVANLGCQIFIDDLIETFMEKDFPKNVSKVLFNPYQISCEIKDVLSLSGWDAVIKWVKTKV